MCKKQTLPTPQSVFALSDLHVDYKANRDWLKALSSTAYRSSVLLVAGDISHELSKLAAALASLLEKFASVFFVPGNHDLWVRKNSPYDSLEKFHQVLAVCKALGVYTRPARLESGPWIVPLFSWYATPEQGRDSLFVPKPGRDLTMALWSDQSRIRWPHTAGTMLDHFFALNEPALAIDYDGPVISLSHFLPRSELIFSNPTPAVSPERVRKYPINFSRVAGHRRLDAQLRQLGSTLHVYGHQHRNRKRTIDGVRYVSHCLGYPQERDRGQVNVQRPKLVWAGGLC